MNCLHDASQQPNPSDLEHVLANSFPVWNQILEHLSATYPQITEKWQFSKQSGWTLRVISKKRTVVYLLPNAGSFKAAFVYGAKATQAAFEGSLPADFKEIIQSARVYVEGRGFRINVENADIFEYLKILIQIKMNN